MKGIIFNLVEDWVVDAHGPAAWDQALEQAGLDGAYTAMGTYRDSDLTALVTAASSVLGVDPSDLTREVGRSALGRLAERFPRFLSPHDSARSFLLTLNDVIHPEVGKLLGDTQPPDFWFDENDPDNLRVHYRSRRRLCAFAEGMIEGAAHHYGQTATVTHLQCMHDGADHCAFDTGLSAAHAAGAAR
ncbi:MAG: heme NO-binding domain-containing protein [Nocardioides sp.]